jgi:hypothetical protein
MLGRGLLLLIIRGSSFECSEGMVERAS